jgi:hypothetical protein
METFQDRMRYAISRCGSQSELARKIQERYGIKVSPQTIQHLQSKSLDKPAASSGLTPQIAAIAGLRAEWLASGKGPKEEPVSTPRVGALEIAEVVPVVITETGETIKMELTKAAIEVAKAFMDLPANERARFLRQIKVAALQHSVEVSDDAVETLATATRPHKQRHKKA